MKVTVSETKGLKTNLNVLVKKQEIDKKIEERVVELQKTVNIKGFRPGKAPINLLKKQFAQALYGEVLEKILQDNTYQALNDNKIKPASQPKIEIKSSGEDKDLEYTISVEKTPDIKKIELEKINLTDYKLKIEKKDLEERINLLAEGQKKYLLYINNLNDLKQFVFEKKTNKFVNKIASELVNSGKIVNSKRLTDSKVVENEILKLH